MGLRFRRGRTAISSSPHDAQMGVLDDDGDDLAAVTGAELDVLAGDHDAAAGPIT